MQYTSLTSLACLHSTTSTYTCCYIPVFCLPKCLLHCLCFTNHILCMWIDDNKSHFDLKYFKRMQPSHNSSYLHINDRNDGLGFVEMPCHPVYRFWNEVQHQIQIHLIFLWRTHLSINPLIKFKNKKTNSSCTNIYVRFPFSLCFLKV